MNRLLSVDLGVKTGIALLNENGEIEFCRSQNFGTKARLNKAIHALLNDLNGLSYLVIEGGGDLLKVWKKEAERMSVVVIQIQAETWRRELLLLKDIHNSQIAKRKAIVLSSVIIKNQTGANPISLTDDAAEALLAGYWALKEVGWRYNKQFFIHSNNPSL